MNRRSSLRRGIGAFLGLAAFRPFALNTSVAQSTLPDGVPSGSIRAEVTGHEDGDKFRVELAGEQETVLLISADAPESGECYAEESADRLRELLPKGQVVYLERDATDRDSKDRLLRYVWKPRDDDKAQFVDERMIADGFSTFKAREENSRRDERLIRAQEIAEEDERGIWKDGSCGGGHVQLTSEPEIEPTPQVGDDERPAPFGTTVNTDGQDIVVTDGYLTYDLNFSTPKGGYVFLVIGVQITNVDDDTHGYTESRFSAKDLDTDANFDDTFAFADQPLGSGELSPGEYVIGQVVLEVQETATRIRVKYDPKSLGSGDEVYWLFHV